MAFRKIDRETWPRREHFEYYTNVIKTNYQINVRLDVTHLLQVCRERGLRFYPVMIYVIMQAVNAREEFRMGIGPDGDLGFYDECHPSYTIFHEDDHSFSDIWSPWDPDFESFYAGVVRDMTEWKDVKGIKGKPGRPDNFTSLSCVPWISFTGIAHDTPGPGPMYFPIITFGKYEERDGRIELPFGLFINHAAADGYHTSMLILDIQKNCDEFGS